MMRRSGDVPLYVQVREKLRSEYSQLEPNTAIPTELELMRRFGVSRITLRKAVDDLVVDGLLERHQGKGTFTSVPKLTHELNAITSWTEQLRALGYNPRTTNRTCTEIAPPRRVAHALNLSGSEKVVMLRRTRLVGDEPLSLMTNYIPSRLVPNIAKQAESAESLYELLERRYHLVPDRATDTVETRAATAEEADTLNVEPWSPILVMTRLSFLKDGSPLELAFAISRGDRYQYRVTLHGRARVDRVE
ncbi:MAG TPA: GntR family transcriptional regulator [Bryobacteraceae bacterium]|nr:GntR family transcriptional regulator [Bryobacteraceae bacterium]